MVAISSQKENRKQMVEQATEFRENFKVKRAVFSYLFTRAMSTTVGVSHRHIEVEHDVWHNEIKDVCGKELVEMSGAWHAHKISVPRYKEEPIWRQWLLLHRRATQSTAQPLEWRNTCGIDAVASAFQRRMC